MASILLQYIFPWTHRSELLGNLSPIHCREKGLGISSEGVGWCTSYIICHVRHRVIKINSTCKRIYMDFYCCALYTTVVLEWWSNCVCTLCCFFKLVSISKCGSQTSRSAFPHSKWYIPSQYVRKYIFFLQNRGVFLHYYSTVVVRKTSNI